MTTKKTKKTKKIYKLSGTAKQKQAVKNYIENNVSPKPTTGKNVLIKSGYSEATAKNPAVVLKGKYIQAQLENARAIVLEQLPLNELAEFFSWIVKDCRKSGRGKRDALSATSQIISILGLNKSSFDVSVRANERADAEDFSDMDEQRQPDPPKRNQSPENKETFNKVDDREPQDRWIDTGPVKD